MNQEQLEAKSLGDLREIAKLQGVKSITKYRKSDLVRIIMNGGTVPLSDAAADEATAAAEDSGAPAQAQQPAQPAARPEADTPSVPVEPRPMVAPDAAAPRMRPAYTPRPQ